MYTDRQMYGLITKPQPELIARYDLINKPDPDELYHFGILGMKWGVRRYQNKDGSYTKDGKERYGIGDDDKDYGSEMNKKETIKGEQVRNLMNKLGVDYDEVYSEAIKDNDKFKDLLDSEDPDDYREAEIYWYEKHMHDRSSKSKGV